MKRLIEQKYIIFHFKTRLRVRILRPRQHHLFFQGMRAVMRSDYLCACIAFTAKASFTCNTVLEKDHLSPFRAHNPLQVIPSRLFPAVVAFVMLSHIVSPLFNRVRAVVISPGESIAALQFVMFHGVMQANAEALTQMDAGTFKNSWASFFVVVMFRAGFVFRAAGVMT